MKRFHVHVAVNNVDESVLFYSRLFGAEPSVLKTDYAKWMLDDPRLNFAISNRGQVPGINHLGLQAEDDAELEALHANLQTAGAAIVEEKGANCCYAKSDKYWVTDPQGIPWESFRSLGSIPLFSSDDTKAAGMEPGSNCGAGDNKSSSCCPAPARKATNSCCS